MLKEKTCLSFFPGLGVSERWSCTPQGKAKLLISGAHLSCITSNLLLLKRIPFGRKNIRYQEDGDDILQPSSPSRWDACVIMSFGVEHFVYACYLLSLHSRWWLNASQACEESGHLLRRSEGLKLIALCNPVLSWCDPPSQSIWSQYLATYDHEVCSLVLTVATVHDWGWRQWTAKAHWPRR